MTFVESVYQGTSTRPPRSSRIGEPANRLADASRFVFLKTSFELFDFLSFPIIH